MSNGLTSLQIKGALTSKYPKPEWASLCELDEYTSAGHGCRRIDFYAVSCYASKGWRTVACEVKVNRSDWIKEAQDPSKRAGFELLACEFWYVSPPNVIRADECPASCGLYHVTDSLTFRTMKVAPYTQVDSLPLPFVAALLRKTTADVPWLARAAWKHEGQEIDAKTLRDLIRATYGKESERYFAEAREKRTSRNPENSAWEQFGRQIGSMINIHTEAPTRADFERWLTEKGRLTPGLAYHLKDLREKIDALVG